MAGKVAPDQASIPSEFMYCRAFRRHTDDHQNDTVVQNARGEVIEFTRHLLCTRCGFESWTTYSVPSFEVTHRKSNYQDNYQVKGGLKGPEAKRVYLDRLGYKMSKERKPK